MAIELSARSSRRSLLTAVGAAAAGAVAASVAGAQRVLAAGDDGKVIHVGDKLLACQSTTVLHTTQWSTDTVLDLKAFHGGDGLVATSFAGDGVQGSSDNGIGVGGHSRYWYGVDGTSLDSVGVHGKSYYGVAVQGEITDPNNRSASAAVSGLTNGTGPGVKGESLKGFGVLGAIKNPDNGSAAVSGLTNGTGPGVKGESLKGFGVLGLSNSNNQPSVFGLKQSHGNAVWGRIADPTSGWGAVYGSTDGTGPGALGENSADGVGTWGRALGKGPGVYGESKLGRGGWFLGKAAQIRLEPSAAATHPATGLSGDLFVDAGNRLWFCLGGATWKQVALV